MGTTTASSMAASTTSGPRLPQVGMLLHLHRVKHTSPVPPPTELPATPVARMSNSDRAKYYRRQHKERTHQLIASAAVLRREVRQLALQAQVLRALVECGVEGPRRDRILTHMGTFLMTPRLQFPGFTIDVAEATRVTAYGSNQATVLHSRLEIQGQYPSKSLEAVYSSFPGNSVLLDTLLHSHVRYQCVIRTYFGPDGDFERYDVDVDWVAGLMGCVGSITDVAKIVAPFQRLGRPCVDTWER